MPRSRLITGGILAPFFSVGGIHGEKSSLVGDRIIIIVTLHGVLNTSFDAG